MQNLTCTRCSQEYELSDLELWQIRAYGPDFCPKCMEETEKEFAASGEGDAEFNQ